MNERYAVVVGVDGAVVVSAVDSTAASDSPPSAPKTSTAVSIPTKKTKQTTTNAGSPRPG